MSGMSSDYIKSIIEAVLFVSEKPVLLEQFREVLGEVPNQDIRNQILELKTEYETYKRGISVLEIAGGFQMLSSPDYAVHIRQFFKTRVKEKLSKPALETLAIVAYKQPVSRGDIELIRGVNSDGVVTNLEERTLIKIVGRKDVPGRPYLYGTTKQFLEYFGLKSLEDLPKLENFANFISAKEDKEMASDPSGQEDRAVDQAISQKPSEEAEVREQDQKTIMEISAPENTHSENFETQKSAAQPEPNLEEVMNIVDPENQGQPASNPSQTDNTSQPGGDVH